MSGNFLGSLIHEAVREAGRHIVFKEAPKAIEHAAKATNKAIKKFDVVEAGLEVTSKIYEVESKVHNVQAKVDKAVKKVQLESSFIAEDIERSAQPAKDLCIQAGENLAKEIHAPREFLTPITPVQAALSLSKPLVPRPRSMNPLVPPLSPLAFPEPTKSQREAHRARLRQALDEE